MASRFCPNRLAYTLGLAILLMLVPLAHAQGEGVDATSGASLAPDGADWLDDPGRLWPTGLILALLGAAGAMAVLLGIVGGTVPWSQGTTEIDAMTAHRDRLTERMMTLADANPLKPKVFSALESAVNRIRDDVAREKWRQFFTAGFLFVVVGTVIAATFADNYAAALAIGAGWTAVVGSLGLKLDYAARAAKKDRALEEAQRAIAAKDALIASLRQAIAQGNSPASQAVATTLQALGATAAETPDLSRRIQLALDI